MRDRLALILIGVVSLTGAFATWRSVTLSSQASDADRQSILETAEYLISAGIVSAKRPGLTAGGPRVARRPGLPDCR